MAKAISNWTSQLQIPQQSEPSQKLLPSLTLCLACVPCNAPIQVQAHAWLAGLGYGVLLPLGALVARHLKVFLDPAWFYAHATLQTLGYLLGASGWGVGIWLYQQHTAALPSDHETHFAVGTTVFCLSTLQVRN